MFAGTGGVTKRVSPISLVFCYMEQGEQWLRSLGDCRAAVVAGTRAVMVMMKRDGELRAKVVPNTLAETLYAELDTNVAPGADLVTDKHRSYGDSGSKVGA